MVLVLNAYTSGSGNFTAPAGVTSVEVVVVAAGGGGGGAGYGGGGGAGGVVLPYWLYCCSR